MKQAGVFFEEQKFCQGWVKAILYLVLGFSLIVPFLVAGNGEWSAISFLPLLISIALIFLFIKMKLIVTIDEQKIAYRFYPIHTKDKILERKDIREISVARYKPVAEYGGWGIRMGQHGTAYTVSGVHGVRISTNTNKHILIGTNRPEEVRQFLIAHQYIPAAVTPNDHA